MDGIYALADPSSAVATINMNDEFNFFGKKAYLMGRTFTAFPPINDAPMQKEIVVAAPEPAVEEKEGSWWGNLALGTIATAALAGAAYLAFGAATVATGGAALVLVGVCLAGAAAATATVTVAASYEDAKSGHTRTTSEFVSQLTAGAVKGATTAAILYGLWHGIPAASALLGGELTALFPGSVLSVINFTKLSAGAGYLLMAVQAIRGGSEIESIANGYNWLLETIFGGDENTYNDITTIMDGISFQVIMMGIINAQNKPKEGPKVIRRQTYDDWETMKKDYNRTVTKFVEDNKPLGATHPRNWLNGGGSLTIDTLSDGTYIWYYNKDGVTVPYVPQMINGVLQYVVKFPEEYLYEDERISQFFMPGGFTGDREADKAYALEYLSGLGYDRIPKGYVLHHDVDNGVFQLVSESVHKSFSHYGGHFYNNADLFQ